jgi:hypothetical protein|tara:strand:+ start:490 stop:645 length:156 start_codon:yes stop_codon:yes gene_type:complete
MIIFTLLGIFTAIFIFTVIIISFIEGRTRNKTNENIIWKMDNLKTKKNNDE